MNIMRYSIKEIMRGWLILSRPPFHIVGILPFILGSFLAYRLTSLFNLEVFILGVSGVIMIMLSTYHAGEYFDYRGDILSNQLHKNQFAGGSRILPSGKLPPAIALWTSVITFLVAAAIGIILQFVYKTGTYTLVLGALGAFPGFFYSTPPVRLVKRGIGEIFIGFCYGWLPVASAYYIQTGTIAPIIHWLGIPIGLSVFNVILLNEFPDYEADKATDKKNLLYRAGKQKGIIIFMIISLLTSLTMLTSFFWGIPFKVIYFYLPFLIISLFIVAMALRGKHENGKTLEILCGLNIAVNLGTSLSFILAYI
jgi:1,4-dihydroxy-2-naphthoate octaprenyltransferase